MLEDGPDLFRGIRWEEDLVGLEDRDDTGIQFLGEVEVHVAQRKNDSCPCPGVLFMEPEERVEGIVENLVRQEIVGIIEADHDYNVPLDHSLADVMQDFAE